MSAAAKPSTSYDQGVVAVGALLWGEGFLAPGGAQSVRDIVAGLDLAGKALLDIGCGTAGAEIVLAGELGARVTGIDIEPQLVEQGQALVARHGLEQAIDLRCVRPGPLPFGDGAFDLVFGKDSWLLIEDKPGFFAELYRVLRPGGRLAAGEWLGNGAPPSPDMKRYFALRGLTYRLEPVATYRRLLRDAGFVNISVEESVPAYAETARGELARLQGPLRAEIEALLGAEGCQSFIARWEAMTVILRNGELRSGYLHAQKPA